MNKPIDPERELKVQILSLEYEALRADILMRASARYQFLGFTTAAAAILATAAGSRSLGAGVWILVVLAAGIFMFGFASFWYLGSYVAVLSERVAEIESRINELVPVDPSHRQLLSWESDNQRRTRVDRWLMGHWTKAARWAPPSRIKGSGDSNP